MIVGRFSNSWYDNLLRRRHDSLSDGASNGDEGGGGNCDTHNYGGEEGAADGESERGRNYMLDSDGKRPG